jgi:hypothetical protein
MFTQRLFSTFCLTTLGLGFISFACSSDTGSGTTNQLQPMAGSPGVIVPPPAAAGMTAAPPPPPLATGGVPGVGVTDPGGAGGTTAAGGMTAAAGSPTGPVTPIPSTPVPRIECDTPERQLPYNAFGDFFFHGWMGDQGDLGYPAEADVTANCAAGDAGTFTSCLGFTFSGATAAMGWAGIAFQNANGNWGGQPGLCIAAGATKITFWAKGAVGGEQIGFSGPGTPMGAGERTLTTEWVQYEVPIGNAYLDETTAGGVALGFIWAAGSGAGPMEFYVADPTWEE